MVRRTKDQVRDDNRPKKVALIIRENKWLSDAKFFPSNYWSMAHYQSWAVKGQAGSCFCGIGHYSGSLCNKRRNTRVGGGKEHCKHVMEKLCYKCIAEIEKQIGVEFKRSYAP